jgi:hypothetical protein
VGQNGRKSPLLIASRPAKQGTGKIPLCWHCEVILRGSRSVVAGASTDLWKAPAERLAQCPIVLDY